MAYKFSKGSRGLGDIAFEDDADTGIDFESDTIKLETNGVERVVVTNTGLGVGISNPSTTLHAYADAANAYVATIDNDAGTSAHGLKVTTDGTGTGTNILALEAASTTVFKVRGDGRVGIGVATPGSTLSVDDEIAVGEKLIHRGDPDTYLQFPSNDNMTFSAGGSEELKIASDGVLVKEYIKHDGDENTWMRFVDDGMTFKAGGISFINLDQKASAPHELTFNDGSNNIDLIVKGNGSGAGNPGMKFDADTNRLGINGVGTPDKALHVGGSMKLDGTQPTIFFADGDTEKAEIGINSSDNILIENKTINKHIVFKVNDQGTVKEGLRLDGAVPEVVVNQTSDSLVDFRVESDDMTHMLFVDGSQNRVGVGAPDPQSTLHIHADSINNGAVTISQSDNSGDASQLDLMKSRGSGASPATVQSNDFLGQVRFLAYDGNSYDNFADIYVQASNTISTTSHPTKMIIRTTRENATSPTTALTIDETQNVKAEGNLEANEALIIRNDVTPSSASDFGMKGEIRWDSNYIYVCVATDTWKRVALSTW